MAFSWERVMPNSFLPASVPISSILDIQLTGQLGKATIERVDDNQGTVTLYIFEQADYPWEAVGVEALALSAYATADVSDGDTLDFRNPER